MLKNFLLKEEIRLGRSTLNLLKNVACPIIEKAVINAERKFNKKRAAAYYKKVNGLETVSINETDLRNDLGLKDITDSPARCEGNDISSYQYRSELAVQNASTESILAQPAIDIKTSPEKNKTFYLTEKPCESDTRTLSQQNNDNPTVNETHSVVSVSRILTVSRCTFADKITGLLTTVSTAVPYRSLSLPTDKAELRISSLETTLDTVEVVTKYPFKDSLNTFEKGNLLKRTSDLKILSDFTPPKKRTRHQSTFETRIQQIVTAIYAQANEIEFANTVNGACYQGSCDDLIVATKTLLKATEATDTAFFSLTSTDVDKLGLNTVRKGQFLETMSRLLQTTDSSDLQTPFECYNKQRRNSSKESPLIKTIDKNPSGKMFLPHTFVQYETYNVVNLCYISDKRKRLKQKHPIPDPKLASENPFKRAKRFNVDHEINEVPGRKSTAIHQLEQRSRRTFLERIEEDPRSIHCLSSQIFRTGLATHEDTEVNSVIFDELVDILSLGNSSQTNLRNALLENICSAAGLSREEVLGAELIFDFKQGCESDDIAKHVGKVMEFLQNDDHQSKGNFRLIVVTAEVFENAMRQCQIAEYSLTFSNYFPRNCRMFIAIPVYKGGLINRRDNKDRR